MYEWKGHASPAMGWRYEPATMERLDAEGRNYLERIRAAIEEKRKIPVGPRTIVTPSARDLAGEADVLAPVKG